jgi:hypothetical protein
MATVHDAAVRDDLKRRVQSLRPNAPRLWGKMSVDQMLWHVNESFRLALGEARFQPIRVPPLPKPLIRWVVLNVPWPKGRAPTYVEMVARETYDFAAEQRRCLEFVDRMAAQRIDGDWPDSPTLGAMSGTHWSQLQAKHLEHHLRQFGV